MATVRQPCHHISFHMESSCRQQKLESWEQKKFFFRFEWRKERLIITYVIDFCEIFLSIRMNGCVMFAVHPLSNCEIQVQIIDAKR